MKDFNYYHVVSKGNDEFDIHCDCISITGFGTVEFTQIWNDITISIDFHEISIISQINPLDAGMDFTCYNDLIRAFTENHVNYEVIL